MARTSLVAVRGVGDVVVARMCGGFVIDIVDGDLCRSVEHFADIDCDSYRSYIPFIKSCFLQSVCRPW